MDVVEIDALLGADIDGPLFVRLEAGERDVDAVVAANEVGEDEGAVLFGGEGAGLFGEVVSQNDDRVGDGGPGGVDDGSADLSAFALSEGRRG
jgi:hypothetical protein